jgi:paraquat-inducible protein B
VSGGLAQIQQRLMDALDKINNLPLNPLIEAGNQLRWRKPATMRVCRPRWIT